MKLVRDRIPELATSNGQPATFHQADPSEYARLLRAKLLEEAAEAGLAAAEIECARARKARIRGAFARRVVWHDPAARKDGAP